MNEPPDPRSSMWNLIASQLRFLRRHHGWSGNALAELLNCARSSISRLENGHAKLTLGQAEKIDTAWNTGGLFAHLVYYATFASDPEWGRVHMEYEARATAIKVYEGHVIPGLLQTEDYARALFVAFGTKDLEGQVARRMGRQQILVRPDAPSLWVLLAQPALEWPVGGCDVMSRQLVKLLDASELSNVSVRIVPKSAGAHMGLGGSISLMTAGPQRVAYTEGVSGSLMSLMRA